MSPTSLRSRTAAPAADLTCYCPNCYAENPCGSDQCHRCHEALDIHHSYDDRLVWALDHPNTATAELAANILARRRTRSAIPALINASASTDVYRAVAATRAPAVFLDDERAGATLTRLTSDARAVVRKAALRAAAGRAGSG